MASTCQDGKMCLRVTARLIWSRTRPTMLSKGSRGPVGSSRSSQLPMLSRMMSCISRRLRMSYSLLWGKKDVALTARHLETHASNAVLCHDNIAIAHKQNAVNVEPLTSLPHALIDASLVSRATPGFPWLFIRRMRILPLLARFLVVWGASN